jgi:hypothetical protein
MIDPHVREDTPEITGRTLRQFAALCVLLTGGLAIWSGVAHGHVGRALVLGLGAAVLVLVGAFRPEALRPLFALLVAVTTPIGRVVSILLLAVLFYGVFTPLALFFRVIGRDALHRRRRQTESYWVAIPETTDPRRYLRQS